MKIPIPFKVVRALIAYLEMERENILVDMEHKGVLLPALSWAENENLLEVYDFE